METFEDFQTPFFVDHSEAENIRGGAGRDILTGFGGDDILIGEDGIDNAIYRGQFADYEITQQSDEIWLVKQLNDGPDDTDIVAGIERLQFSDQWLALDLNGNAGIIAKTLGAVFGPESVSNQTFIGIGLNLLDDDLRYEALMQFAIDAALGADATYHAAVVDLLYENVVGVAPAAADQEFYVDLLDAGMHTVASIGVFAAETELNQENVNLVGLSQTGLTYLPVAGS
jgi:Ca2+-binding RTX toxin-like protein